MSSGDEAKIVWKTEQPRAGGALEGNLRLLGIPKPEQVYRVALTCERRYRVHVDERRARVETEFAEEQDIRVVQTAEGWSVPFRFDIPVTAPASDHSDSNPEGYLWRFEFYRADSWIAFPTGYTVAIGPAPADEIAALEATETPAQKAAIAVIAKAAGRDSLLPHERAQARALPPADLATVRKGAEMSRKLMGGIVIAFFGLPLVIFILVILMFIGVVIFGK